MIRKRYDVNGQRTTLDDCPDIAVVVVNYNTRDDLRACLHTVFAAGAREVLVADNASSDGSAQMVRAAFPAARLLARTVNDGYGAAANVAIRACRLPYVLLLNSDTLLRRDTLTVLRAYLHEHPRAAVVGPRLVYPDGSPQRSAFPAPTALATLIQESRRIGIRLQRLLAAVPRLRRRYLLPSAGPVDWTLGAALALRRDAFLACGGFEESFFMYFEEVDLCHRLRAMGWEIHFAPRAQATHVGGASTRQAMAAMQRQRYLSQLHFARRHFGPAGRAALRAVLIYIILRNFVRDTVRLRRTARSGEQAGLRANLQAWRGLLPQLLAGGRRAT